MRRYEGLFILDTAGSADGGPKAVEAVKKLIIKAGGKVETEQKMDRRQFERVASKKHTGGFYTNLVFELEPAAMDGLDLAKIVMLGITPPYQLIKLMGLLFLLFGMI